MKEEQVGKRSLMTGSKFPGDIESAKPSTKAESIGTGSRKSQLKSTSAVVLRPKT
jgi:hypothetical protein